MRNDAPPNTETIINAMPPRPSRDLSRQPARRRLANAVRALSMDAVERARSGHPGMPMGMADVAEVLWNDHLKHNPGNPLWFDRDRFVLSNGHGSMLLYSLLHLSGYPMPMDEIKRFRQLHSKTPGHPEYDPARGIETTTGPLGQGLANAVGMALAERVLARRFNRDGLHIVDHRTWVFTGDGCLMEGISHEACSLAGTQGLGKLIVFYDDNGVSIDGDVSGWFTDDTPRRFEAYGWHVERGVDGHDADAVHAAIARARADAERPSLLCCKTVIGYGAPNKQGRASCHGAPLGDGEVALARAALDWPYAPFEVPDDVRRGWDARERGAAMEREWREILDAYRVAHPSAAAEFERCIGGHLPRDWDETARAFIADVRDDGDDVATRKASQRALSAFSARLPELIGGSADLAGSNGTSWQGSRAVSGGNGDGNYIYFGVREFAMSAIASGIALHRGLIPYAATFLTFSDYARNAVRMAALMGQRVVFIYTHDSVALGEDGPTHQPVEHLAALRLIPNLDVWRPCDAVEAVVAWKAALESKATPNALVFSRQTLTHVPRDDAQIAAIERGGYVLRDCEGGAELVLIATGSEVSLALRAHERLRRERRRSRVVAMPCAERFERQPRDYRESVLPTGVPRVAVEAGRGDWWRRYVGLEGAVVGLEEFGVSAPGDEALAHFGFTPDAVYRAGVSLMDGGGQPSRTTDRAITMGDT